VAVPVPTETLRQFDRLAFVSRRPARAGTGGEHVSRRPSPSTDFIEYRPYQPGDDFRRVDWNIYGRLGSLQVKVTEGRERLDVLLVLDCSSSMAYGEPPKLAYGAALGTALAYIGAARADSVRVVCLGSDSAPGVFRRGARMPDLSGIAPVGLVDLNAGLAGCVPERAPAGMLAVVISDFLTPAGVGDGLEALRARVGDLAVIHLVAPDELEPRLSGELELIDAESGAALELGLSMATLSAYRARFEEWLEDRARDCQRRGLRYVRLRTDTPLATAVLSDLRRGGLLR
jgi:uncharacterized protein (DUF58 family)